MQAWTTDESRASNAYQPETAIMEVQKQQTEQPKEQKPSVEFMDAWTDNHPL